MVLDDQVVGRFEGVVDDVVLARADGVPAYNLAVVVDDAAQQVTHVVRGDDLLSSTPRQMYLQQLLGLPTPTYAHIPLVVGPTGDRLAKRDGAVTARELQQRGVSAVVIRDALARSIGCEPVGDDADDPVAWWASQWSMDGLPRDRWPVDRFNLPT